MHPEQPSLLIPTTLLRAEEIPCFTSSAKAVFISSVVSEIPVPSCNIIIADTKKSAYLLTSDLYNFFTEEVVYYLPTLHDKNELKEATAKVQRTAVISALTNFENNGNTCNKDTFKKYQSKGRFVIDHIITNKEVNSQTPHLIVVTYPEALLEKVPKSERTRKSILKIKVGERLSHDFIKELLFENNFQKVDFVSKPGEFALRGSIIDLFSYSDNQPYRVDFFEDEIESIRRFDVNTQKSIENITSVDIYPNLFNTFQQTDYVDIWDILPKDAVIWDLRFNISKNVDDPQIIPQPTFSKNFELLSQDIKKKTDEGYSVNILSPNDSQTLRLKQILRDIGGGARPNFMQTSLHEGFVNKIDKVCYYTDHQIFERYHKIKVKREVPTSERLTINDLTAFNIGDYVVHIDHGVGQYGGLVKTNVNGRMQEAIKLIYKDNDVIFVSIHGIHRISKYKSKDGEPPKIYKLGTKAWENLKNSTKAKVKDIAKDLIKLYSQRQQVRGFAFSQDCYLQGELESSFIYEDTPDQQKATVAVKEDMESIHPMDRLVCGDVGFGKTEIAIRAAFKAACDGKQVAVLVPTTILALQHYRTFQARLKEFPCTIDYISRLRSSNEIKVITQKLKEGKIDIIIGTHRLLNKQVEFKDLGLLVIDEEQKFGVSAKEKIRQIKTSVDTLTLTATPIPRTLQFSLLGARDLSIINTPPPNRLPVYTEVINFDEEVISDIISNELERGGQIYFVHNKVEDILAVKDILQRIAPNASICVAHGQMEPVQLEKKIVDFVEGDYDILLATTIVENGIDIPNANTIIINQAQNFGLSDLHQLRGRVGRSNIKAFCYLVIPPIASLSDDARRRIKAIEAFSDLGSGFNIAMQDLDIRGAGNLLGAEQSGFIADMGFETYMRILNEAVNELALEPEIAEIGSITSAPTGELNSELTSELPSALTGVSLSQPLLQSSSPTSMHSSTQPSLRSSSQPSLRAKRSNLSADLREPFSAPTDPREPSGTPTGYQNITQRQASASTHSRSTQQSIPPTPEQRGDSTSLRSSSPTSMQSGTPTSMHSSTQPSLRSSSPTSLRAERSNLANQPLLPQLFAGAIDTQVETDLEVLIPDNYVSIQAEKIRLYKELDSIGTEQRLLDFAATITDRFGPIPPQLEELINVVRLRFLAQTMGLERIVLKNNIMLAYFISNKMSPFYQSDIFGKILDNLQKFGRRYILNENANKLYIKVTGITSVSKAVTVLRDIHP